MWNDLPVSRILALGTSPENERPGYVKYPFPGGINLIFSSIPVAEEDQLDEPRAQKPFVDHFGIDLRRETGVVRALYEDTLGLGPASRLALQVARRRRSCRVLLPLDGCGEVLGVSAA